MAQVKLEKKIGGWTLTDKLVIKTYLTVNEWEFHYAGVTSHIDNPENASYIERFLVVWSQEVAKQWNKKITTLEKTLQKWADQKEKEIQNTLDKQVQAMVDPKVIIKDLKKSLRQLEADLESKVNQKKINSEVEDWIQAAHDDTEKAIAKGKDPYTPSKRTFWNFKKNALLCTLSLTAAVVTIAGLSVATMGIAPAIFAILGVAVGLAKGIQKGVKAVKALKKELDGSFKRFGKDIQQIDKDLGNAISDSNDMSNAIDAIEMRVRQCAGDGKKFAALVKKVSKEDWGPLKKEKEEALKLFQDEDPEKFIEDLKTFNNFKEDLLKQRIALGEIVKKYQKSESKWMEATSTTLKVLDKGEALATAIIDTLESAAP